jgi:NAD(P)-dependent dehydrogenase (short-subunit alcohol dehydrogenase family)
MVGLLNERKLYNKWQGYGQSKTANILMALSLAEKLVIKHNLFSFSLSPGVIRTKLSSHLDLKVECRKIVEIARSFGTCTRS